MIIEYYFCNETVAIEVSEEWGRILEELNREEYNNKQTERRRHCSLEALRADNVDIPSDIDLEADTLKSEEYEELHAAILQLSPRHQWLIKQIYFEGKKYCDLAVEEGTNYNTIRCAIRRANKILKKIINSRDRFGHFRDFKIEGFIPLSTLTTEYTTIQHDPVDHAKCENHSMLHATIHNWGARMQPTNVGRAPP